MPVGDNADNGVEDGVVTRLTWSKQMELKDRVEGHGDSPVDCPGVAKFALPRCTS